LERAAPLGMVDWLVQFCSSMNERNKMRNATIERLEARVAELEARPNGLKYCGTWKPATTYAVSECVTWDGSLWIALERTSSNPATSPSAPDAGNSR
jgi:hypothetical protein